MQSNHSQICSSAEAGTAFQLQGPCRLNSSTASAVRSSRSTSRVCEIYILYHRTTEQRSQLRTRTIYKPGPSAIPYCPNLQKLASGAFRLLINYCAIEPPRSLLCFSPCNEPRRFLPLTALSADWKSPNAPEHATEHLQECQWHWNFPWAQELPFQQPQARQQALLGLVVVCNLASRA